MDDGTQHTFTMTIREMSLPTHKPLLKIWQHIFVFKCVLKTKTHLKSFLSTCSFPCIGVMWSTESSLFVKLLVNLRLHLMFKLDFDNAKILSPSYVLPRPWVVPSLLPYTSGLGQKKEWPVCRFTGLGVVYRTVEHQLKTCSLSPVFTTTRWGTGILESVN